MGVGGVGLECDRATVRRLGLDGPELLAPQHAEVVLDVGAIRREGRTVVPLQVYFNEKGRAKIEIALVTGKQAHDKRETIRRREIDRETRAAVKARSR